MGKGSSKAPEAPDPEVVIPLQTQANKDIFDYALQQQRATSITPGGTQSWSQEKSFDQAGYDAALAAYNQQKAALDSRYTKPVRGGGGFGAEGSGAGGVPGAANLLNSSDKNYQKELAKLQAPDRNSFSGTPQWTYRETLSPQQQALYDAQVKSQLGQSELLGQGTERLTEALEKQYSLPPGSLTTNITGGDRTGALDYARGLAQRSVGDNYNNTVADATYNQQRRYLDVDTQRADRALQARLAEQGFVPGTPGYAQAMEVFQDTNNRAYGNARDTAVQQGYAQGNTQLGLQTGIAGLLGNLNNQSLSGEIAAGTFENQARQQQIAEQLQLRNQPLNELNALRTGAQVAGPTGQAQYSTPNLANTDVIGAYNNKYQGDLGAYNAETAQNNGIFGGLVDLGLGLATGGGSSLFSGLGGLFTGGAGAASRAPTGGSGFRF
jgi:hypothetical protein